MQFVHWVACAILLGTVSFQVFALINIRQFLRRHRHPVRTGDLPGISVLMPIKGIAPGFERAMTALLRQRYPGSLQIILAFQDGDDPAIELTEALLAMTKHSHLEVVVLKGLSPLGLNPKNSNLVHAYRQARFEWIFICDADTALPETHLWECMVEADNNTNCFVTALSVHEGAGTVSAACESIGTNLTTASYFALAYRFEKRPGPINGAAYLFHRTLLARSGGIESILNTLTDDAFFQIAFLANGGVGRLVPSLARVFLPKQNFRGYFRRVLRWMMIARFYFPLSWITPFLWPGQWLIAIGVLSSDALLWQAGLGVLSLRVLQAGCVQWLLGVPAQDLLKVPALFMVDALAPVVWLASLFTQSVQWGSTPMRVQKHGALIGESVPTLRSFLALLIGLVLLASHASEARARRASSWVNTLGCAALWAMSASSAQAALEPVYYDAGGMPVCVTDPQNPHDGALIAFDADNHYGRDVYIYRLSEGSGYDDKRDSCADWQKPLKRLKADPFWRRWAPFFVVGNGAYKGIAFNSDILAALDQIRRGMNIRLREVSADQWLSDHPNFVFNAATNAELTRQFGTGFTAEVYQAWIARDPANKAFRERVLWHVNQYLSGKSVSLAQKFVGYHVVVAEGYMQSYRNDRLGPFKWGVAYNGVTVSHSTYDTLGSFANNVAALKVQIRDLLDRGQKVIVSGGSKGVAEALTAVGEINQEIEAGSYRPPGKISAFINFSGMVQGSYIVDWASRGILGWIVNAILKNEATTKHGLKMKDNRGFTSMRSEVLNPVAEINKKRLPKNIPYFNIVGAIGGDGMASDKDIRLLQENVIIPRLGQAAANDGYVVLPGTQIPASWAPGHVWTLVVNGSHVVLDGTFASLDLQDPLIQAAIMYGLLATLADQMDHKFP